MEVEGGGARCSGFQATGFELVPTLLNLWQEVLWIRWPEFLALSFAVWLQGCASERVQQKYELTIQMNQRCHTTATNRCEGSKNGPGPVVLRMLRLC